MHTYECTVGGKTLTFSVGKFAHQANASLTVQYGETVVMATITQSDSSRPGVNYFPLMVDYEEKLYASGKIKGSRFIKREGRPTDEAVTNGRMIDRTIRPLFDQRTKEDLQVVTTVLSYDEENDADVLAITAAAAVAAISDVPFNVLVSGVRVARVDGAWAVNPTVAQVKESDLDLIVASSKEKVLMLEGDAAEISEEDFIEAVVFGKQQNGIIIETIEKMVQEIGKEKFVISITELPEELSADIRAYVSPKIEDVLYLSEKQDRKKGLKVATKELSKELAEKYGDQHEDIAGELPGLIAGYITRIAGEIIRDNILDDGRRIDGRAVDQIRPLQAEAGILPRPHGTGLFMRGETQVLTVATLGSPGAEQILDGMEVEYKKGFMHHYNFPSFSVGEVGPNRGPSRRDIGHGTLAERAIARLMPKKEDFPYTIRLVSEVFGSNGSSSMAATCGSSLSLMDAGVPLKKHVAGVAMGVSQGSDGKYVVLTDLQDLEDSEGGMDFKLAGTKDGITVVQLDVKSDGLSDDIVRDTVMQNKKARLELIAVMSAALPEARSEMSPYAPRIEKIMINPDKIRSLIGPGGKMINGIIEETGVEIDIEDSGLVLVTSTSEEAATKAMKLINDVVKEAKAGEIYEGTVVKIMDFGAFVSIFGSTEGLIHISKLSKERVNKVEDVVKVGEKVMVKVLEIDNLGRINLAKIDKA